MRSERKEMKTTKEDKEDSIGSTVLFSPDEPTVPCTVDDCTGYSPYYQDDRVTLYHGDSMEIMPRLSADIIVTDPPYGVRKDEEWDNLNDREFALQVMEWLPKAKRIADELVVFCPSDSVVRDLCRMLWPRVRGCIWDKPTGSQTTGAQERGMWFSHETILHCYTKQEKEFVAPKNLAVAHLLKQARETAGMSKGGVDMVIRGKKTGLCYRWEEGACLPSPEQVEKLLTILPLNKAFTKALEDATAQKEETIKAMRAAASETAAEGRDVFSYRPETNTLHSCQKPWGLMSELVQRLTEKGQTVLDPFAGSGTTLLAASEHGRKAIGIEQDEKHCETIANRFCQMTLPLDFAEPKNAHHAPTQPELF